MKPLLLITCFLVSLLFSGCAPHIIQATPAQRTASIAPYAQARIDGVPLSKFLASRIPLLLQAEDVEVTRTGKNDFHLKFLKAPDSIGTASAIDPRGYYLTAAHCIRKVPPLVFFHTSTGAKIERCRVVWMGEKSKGEPDLALIHVPFPLDPVFSWAEGIAVENKVIAAGYSLKPNAGWKFEEVAGKVMHLDSPDPGLFSCENVLHDAPLSFGNSGGTLVTPEGRLIGINVLMEAKLDLPKFSFQQSAAIALRPAPVWIKRLIDRDQLSLSQKGSSSR